MLWKFNYNPSTVTATNGVVIVNSMNNADHITRTIVNPIKNPTLLVVSRGSNDNLDLDSFSSTAGRAMVKVFNLNSVPSGGYNFTTQGNPLSGRYLPHTHPSTLSPAGSVLGYGIRNEVGMVNKPIPLKVLGVYTSCRWKMVLAISGEYKIAPTISNELPMVSLRTFIKAIHRRSLRTVSIPAVSSY
jgi:hypothetical protein